MALKPKAAEKTYTRKGQSPTTFRSKLPELVQQAIYALVITYTLVCTLIYQATAAPGHDPIAISFLETLHHTLDAAPVLTATAPAPREQKRQYSLTLIADCRLDRPRRPRLNPRVVKVKMSKFARKSATHKSEVRVTAKILAMVL